ncbi:MAG: glycosyltransferase family 2 protein [Coriobacteriia bacterium]|nr:glycosyltransferase family 2 protein [Coriobacteriia bacterium]
MPPSETTLISIVTPCYNEEGNVEELLARIDAVFTGLPAYTFELIAVENGSFDGTWDRLSAMAVRDERVKVVRLSRNFGADGGITAGLEYARGAAAVLMTADLQDPPEVIPAFVEKWEQGFQNVYGIVTKRVGVSAVRRMNSQLFYWLMNKLTGGVFPRNVSDFRLVDRRVYETINGMNERNRFLRGMFFWSGFRSTGVEHERPPRFAGESKAGTMAMISLALRSILSFSYFPLRLITILGLTISALSIPMLLYIVVRVLMGVYVTPGFGTIMAVMLLMFGFLFTMLGVVAEYVGLIYDEVKQRPNFIVSETIGL